MKVSIIGQGYVGLPLAVAATSAGYKVVGIDNNKDKLKWIYLSQNENAIHILENNIDKINWYSLSSNKNAIKILENKIHSNPETGIVSL